MILQNNLFAFVTVLMIFVASLIIGAFLSPHAPAFYVCLMIVIFGSITVHFSNKKVNRTNLILLFFLSMFFVSYFMLDFDKEISSDYLINRLTLPIITLVLYSARLKSKVSLSFNMLTFTFMVLVISIIFLTAYLNLSAFLSGDFLNNKIDANMLGGYNALGVVCASLIILIEFLKSKQAIARNIYYSSIAMLTVHVISTASRQGIIYLLFIFIVYFFKNRKNTIGLVSFLVMALSFYFLIDSELGDFYFHRFYGEFDALDDSKSVTSTSERLSLFYQATEFKSLGQFLFGISSVTNFSLNFYPYETRSAHNFFLQILYVNGLAGLIVFLAIAWDAFKKIKIFEIKLLIVFFLFVGLFDTYLYSIQGLAFFTMIFVFASFIPDVIKLRSGG